MSGRNLLPTTYRLFRSLTSPIQPVPFRSIPAPIGEPPHRPALSFHYVPPSQTAEEDRLPQHRERGSSRQMPSADRLRIRPFAKLPSSHRPQNQFDLCRSGHPLGGHPVSPIFLPACWSGQRRSILSSKTVSCLSASSASSSWRCRKTNIIKASHAPAPAGRNRHARRQKTHHCLPARNGRRPHHWEAVEARRLSGRQVEVRFARKATHIVPNSPSEVGWSPTPPCLLETSYSSEPNPSLRRNSSARS
jgi:hypothetical protein